MRIVYKGNYIRMKCGEIGLVAGTTLAQPEVFFSSDYL